MKTALSFFAGVALLATSGAEARPTEKNYLVRFRTVDRADAFRQTHGGQLAVVSKAGSLYRWSTSNPNALRVRDANVVYIQTDRKIGLSFPGLDGRGKEIADELAGRGIWDHWSKPTDNPAIPAAPQVANGPDPLLSSAWGLFKIGAPAAWSRLPMGQNIIVAVIDTGIDYTHPDLLPNLWRNEKEIPGDGIDNDKNGYVDDVIGWDFATNDNKPFDLTSSIWGLLLRGGNPGHGTHVSGVIAAARNNNKGIAGVAPKAKIMGLRFLADEGGGITSNGIKAIDYAVANGARIINASWGGESDPEAEGEDLAMEEAIERARAKGVIFVAAAGNGRNGKGFDNDTDPRPMTPASLSNENIVSVAATDERDKLGKFSNYGKRTTRLGAPGVKVFSTVPGGRYEDTILDVGPITIHWDGTSMAAPHVAGALALLWSQRPDASWNEVVDRLLSMTVRAEALYNKVSTDGRLDLRAAK